MKTVSFSGNQVIFREGDAAETMYEIRSGRVGIFSSYGADGEKQIAVLNEGQILGELGMIERCPRTATAVALSDDTSLAEYGEEELVDFLRSRPDLVLTVLKQMSARIRDVNRKFNEACLALHENEAAVSRGEKKSDDLVSRLEQIRTEAIKQQSYSTSLRSSFFRYVMDDVEECKNYTVVKANIFERLLVKEISPYDLHANPDDEFAQPAVGPNDKIISDYVQMIPILIRMDEDIFSDPVIAVKLSPEGYRILNGHHRWAAALKTGVSRLRTKIINPGDNHSSPPAG